MKKNKKHYLTLALAFMLTGCAGTAGSPDMVRQKLESKYIGKQIDFVISDLGMPNSTIKLDSGRTAYEWRRQTDKYKSNVFVKSDERCVITMMTDNNNKRIETVGQIDDSLGAYEFSYCAEQLGL